MMQGSSASRVMLIVTYYKLNKCQIIAQIIYTLFCWFVVMNQQIYTHSPQNSITRMALENGVTLKNMGKFAEMQHMNPKKNR